MTLIFLTVLHSILFYLPGFGAAGLLTPEGETLPRREFYSIALVSACFFGYLGFWVYFLSTPLGVLYSFLVFLGAGWIVIRRGKAYLAKVPLRFWHPLLASIVLAFFYLGLGFSYGGLDHPLETARVRFSHPATVDNELALTFAKIIHDKAPFRPFVGDWLTSDRPPLQTGITLLHFPFMGALEDLQYQVLGVILQTSIGIGVWLIFSGGGFSESDRALSFLFLAFSSTLLVHSFFIWPKILPAALMMVGYSRLTAANAPADTGNRLRDGILIGAAFALAMLAHGGSIFAILPIGLAVVLYRKLPSARIAAAAVLTATVLYLPWMGYQHFVDPPGDRLIKMHFGGVVEIDERSPLEAIADSYSDLSFGQFLNRKKGNINFILGSPRNVLRAFQNDGISAGILVLRAETFFRLCFALSIPALAVLVLPIRLVRKGGLVFGRPTELIFIGVAGVLLWLLMIFGPPGTFTAIHHGTLFHPLILMSGLFMFARLNSKGFAVFLLGLQALVFLLWIPFIPRGVHPSIDGALMENGLQTGFAGLALLALVGLVGILASSAGWLGLARDGDEIAAHGAG